ncbi:DUF417 family protein [Paraburkholderia panacisoli]|uniref:DUF417 family protein n=1 Tax=Paraburkholderia panacisoli TaxID=2603818 RepID=UPI001FEB98F9|nr:DUF417 family protein [Paraburkholderia panacisoli]
MTTPLLITRVAAPFVSAWGRRSSVTFILTVSFVFSTPGITLHSASGIPIISTLVEQFLIKDIVLLGACLTLVLASLTPRRRVS